MKLTKAQYATFALQFDVHFRLRTSLLLRTGEEGEFADSSVEKTPDNRLHINGYAWASLFRRSMMRLADHTPLALQIGKYPEENELNDLPEDSPLRWLGVSPFWFSPFISDEPLRDTDVISGNSISREYGSAAETAMFADEIVLPGQDIPCRFTVFLPDKTTAESTKKAIGETLWVINDGIENIGGGWSYGHGRLELTRIDDRPDKPYDAKVRELDLTDADNRSQLFDPDSVDRFNPLSVPKPSAFARPWKKFIVNAGVLDGQLLAIHTEQPREEPGPGGDLPDKFLFRLNGQICITGKAVRQALLCVPLERRWRTKEEPFCEQRMGPCSCSKCKAVQANKTGVLAPDCTCKCRVFGSTYRRGMVAVLDAIVENPQPEDIQRISLCEHSMQNINMFSGEYLKGGTFRSEIFVDSMGMTEEMFDSCVREIKQQLDNLAGGNDTPPGWDRLGATSTSTGQVSATIEQEPSHA